MAREREEQDRERREEEDEEAELERKAQEEEERMMREIAGKQAEYDDAQTRLNGVERELEVLEDRLRMADTLRRQLTQQEGTFTDIVHNESLPLQIRQNQLGIFHQTCSTNMTLQLAYLTGASQAHVEATVVVPVQSTAVSGNPTHGFPLGHMAPMQRLQVLPGLVSEQLGKVQEQVRELGAQQEEARRAVKATGDAVRELLARRGKGSRVTKPLKVRLREMYENEKDLVTFAKSGIHGWGLVAKRPVPQDTFITEYRGDVVRRLVADVRENKYRRNGKDCYLFALGDAVIDATDRGHIARFINHSCTPCLYAKTIEVDGVEHLVFVSRVDIRAGQELTFNYRFGQDEDGDRLPCNCGGPNCTGSMN